MDTVRTDSTPAPARQDVAERYQDNASNRDATITRMLTNPDLSVPQAASAPYYEPAAISPDLASAIEAHRKAQQAALHTSDLNDDRTFDAITKHVTALGDVVRTIPARSLADLRCKTIYLWPGSLVGEVADDEFADTLNSFRDDVERLAAAGAAPGGLVDTDLVALGRQFDQAHEAWRQAVEANREPSDRHTAYLAAIEKRRRLTMMDHEIASALPGYIEASGAEDDAFDAVALASSQILRMRPTSLQGLAVLARAAIPNVWATGTYEADAGLVEEGINREASRNLIESCCAAAGVDWRGQPRAVEPVSPGPSAHDTNAHEFAFHKAATELRLATREHNRAVNATDVVWVEQNGGDASTEAMASADGMRKAASARQEQAWRDLFKIRPRTNHQLWLLLRDVAQHFDDNHGMVDEPDVFGALVGAADSLRLASPEITAQHDLTALTIAQLGELADACRRQDKALYDVSRSWCEGALTAVLDRERDRIGLLGTMASAEIERRTPADKGERDERLETLIKADFAGNGYIEPALLAEAVAAWGAR